MDCHPPQPCSGKPSAPNPSKRLRTPRASSLFRAALARKAHPMRSVEDPRRKHSFIGRGSISCPYGSHGAPAGDVREHLPSAGAFLFQDRIKHSPSPHPECPAHKGFLPHSPHPEGRRRRRLEGRGRLQRTLEPPSRRSLRDLLRMRSESYEPDSEEVRQHRLEGRGQRVKRVRSKRQFAA